jgi:hypothetical protein
VEEWGSKPKKANGFCCGVGQGAWDRAFAEPGGGVMQNIVA